MSNNSQSSQSRLSDSPSRGVQDTVTSFHTYLPTETREDRALQEQTGEVEIDFADGSPYRRSQWTPEEKSHQQRAATKVEKKGPFYWALFHHDAEWCQTWLARICLSYRHAKTAGANHDVQ